MSDRFNWEQGYRQGKEEAAAEIERLTGALATCRELREYDQREIERLRAPWRAVDAQDWDYLASKLGWGGRDRFWQDVFLEVRRVLEPPKD